MSDPVRDFADKAMRDALLKRLNSTQRSNTGRWRELVYLIVGWIMHRRPEMDRPGLIQVTDELAGDPERREEVRIMVETYADVLLAEGERKGKLKGEQEGRAAEARELVLRLPAKRLGAVGPEVETAVHAINDLDRLERMLERSYEVATWAELLATL